MNYLYVAIIVFLYGSVGEAEKILPSYVKTCQRNDPNLSACWKDSMVSLLPRLIKGIPEMGLRPIDPVLLPELKVEFGGSKNVNFNAMLKNLTLYGSASVNVRDVSAVYTDKGVIVEQNLTFPVLYMTSDFVAAGQILLLKFDSVGKFAGNFSNTDVTGFWKSNNILKSGKVHGVFDESFVKVKLGSIHVEFDKLMGDNVEINNNINRIINENIDILYDEVSPMVESVINSLVTQSINKVYDLFPMDILYPV